MARRIDIVFSFGVLALLAVPAVLSAQTLPETGDSAAAPGSLDCTEISIDYLDDPTLTRDERIALMDRALTKSLSQYDNCQTDRNKSASSGGGAGSGEAGGGGNGAGSASGQASLPSEDMTGTEEASTAAPLESAQQAAARPKTDSDPETSASDPNVQREAVKTLDNGKIPEDIPPADNDSVLEAQIRQAALRESDPEIKKKLWNEYRKYKGLPSVK